MSDSEKDDPGTFITRNPAEAELMAQCDAVERFAYNVGKLYVMAVETNLFWSMTADQAIAWRDKETLDSKEVLDTLFGNLTSRIKALHDALAQVSLDESQLAVASPAMRETAARLHAFASDFYAVAGKLVEPKPMASDSTQ